VKYAHIPLGGSTELDYAEREFLLSKMYRNCIHIHWLDNIWSGSKPKPFISYTWILNNTYCLRTRLF